MPIWVPDLLTTEKMDRDEKLVFGALWPAHVGRAAAITQEQLAEAVHLPPREMRDIIAAPIITHEIPIGSASGTPPGYFIIGSPGEAAQVYEELTRHGVATLRRRRAIGRIVDGAVRRKIQIELPLTPELIHG